MAPGKRRKGKQWNRSVPAAAAAQAEAAQAQAAAAASASSSNDAGEAEAITTTTATTTTPTDAPPLSSADPADPTIVADSLTTSTDPNATVSTTDAAAVADASNTAMSSTQLVAADEESNPQQQQQRQQRLRQNKKPTPTSTSMDTTGSTTMDTDTIDPTTTTSTLLGASAAASNANCLVLTSEKRRGLYECDYCHADISQLPRIRCAVCPDFDMCLTCFLANSVTNSTTSTSTSTSAGTTTGNISADTAAAAGGGDDDGRDNVIMESSTGTSKSGATTTLKHDPMTHGYRVCDSTRYPLFPTNRNLSLKGVVQSLAGGSSGAGGTGTATGGNGTGTAGGDGGDGDDNEDTNSNNNNNNNDEQQDARATTPSPPNTNTNNNNNSSNNTNIESFVLHDDPRNVWTVEEDLRLIDAIKAHGLGNWTDISEAVQSSHGSTTGKTPKRCMERYLDDFLGRYGHILPPYTLLLSLSQQQQQQQQQQQSEDATTNEPAAADEDNEGVAAESSTTPAEASAATTTASEIRTSKRRAVLLRSPSTLSNQSYSSNLSSMTRHKKFKAVPTESLPEYHQLWPHPYLPPTNVVGATGVTMGQEVGREQTYKAEQTFVKLISQIETQQPQPLSSSSSTANSKNASTDAAATTATTATATSTTATNQAQEALEELRREWVETKLCKPGGPTVLPMRPEDVVAMPGAELAGFMPRRGDFDIEFDNDAEQIVADMEFLPREPAQDRELKLKVLAIYNAKLEEREKRKNFVLSRKLYDYRAIQLEQEKLPRDERDLVHRMRLFERFHTPAEHKTFIEDILKAKRLRKEIAKLQMYRRIGIRTLCEAEMYELDKSRRAFHKTTQQQKAAEAAAKTTSASAGDSAAAAASGSTASATEVSTTSAAGGATTAATKASDETASFGLWKQYRTTDRKNRRSIARGSGGGGDASETATTAATTTATTTEVAAAATTEAAPAEGAEAKSVSSDDDCRDQNQKKAETQDALGSDKKTAPSSESTHVHANQQQESAPSATGAVGRALDEEKSKSPPQLDDALAAMPGYHLLSTREADLCRKLQLAPLQYQEIKRALLHESLTQGLLDKDQASSKRSVLLIDAHRRGDVIDFMVRAGWISTKFAKSATKGNKKAIVAESTS